MLLKIENGTEIWEFQRCEAVLHRGIWLKLKNSKEGNVPGITSRTHSDVAFGGRGSTNGINSAGRCIAIKINMATLPGVRAYR